MYRDIENITGSIKQDNLKNDKKYMQLNVLYQSDENTQLGLGISIASLMINNEFMEEINIYLIDDGINDSFLNQLKEYIESFHRKLIVIPSEIMLDNDLVKQYPCYTGKRKNKHSYLKLFWNVGIEEKMDRLLYIDCDTVIKNDLSDLITMDMKDNIVGMAYDALITDEIVNIGLEKDDPYFNSGIILFDVPKWIEGHCAWRVVQRLKEHGNYGTVDQDVLNVEFKHQIYILPMRYNYQTIHIVANTDTYFHEFKRDNYYKYEEVQMEENQVCIMHFVKFIGQNVWNKGNVHPCKGYFEEYLEQTPWKSIEKSHQNVKFIYIVERILYAVLPRRCFIKIFHIAHRMMINKSG